MKLSVENYHSKEANKSYMSVSQYKNFAGAMGMVGCESKAMAIVRGDWEVKVTPAMLIGSYIDAHFSGTLDVFQAQNPDIFTKSVELKAGFKHADYMIQRIEENPYMLKTLQGENQVWMTADMFGCTWKILMDSYHKGVCIVDLKTCAEIRKSSWVKDFGHVDFIRYWGYDIQMAVYQKVVEIVTGDKLPCMITAVSKEDEPDLACISFDQQSLDEALSLVESNMPRILRIKAGEEEPARCEKCDWCRKTKVITGVIHFSELVQDFFSRF